MTRVVPVVVFLHPGEPARQLRLGTERATYMAVTYISCHLARLNALDYLESTNIVARILLPCMDAPDDRRGEVVAKSIEGLMTLEANVHKQHKYAGFISMYAGLDDQGRVELMERTTRAPWSRNMKSWFDEAEEKGERGASPKARCLASLAARPRWCCGPWRGGSSVPQRRKKSVS